MALGDNIEHVITLRGDLLQRAPVGTVLAAYVLRGNEGNRKTSVDSVAVASDGTVTLNPVVEGERYLLVKTTPRVDTITIDATSGTWTFTYLGVTTAALAENISAANLATAITGLASVGTGNATVSGNDGGPFTVTITGTLAGENDTPSVASVDLAGGAGTVVLTNVTPGAKNDVLLRFRAGTLPGAAPANHPVTRRASGVYYPGV